MKTKTTIKRIFLALTITLCIASCKKDKKDEPTPTPAEVKAITLTDLKALSTAASVKVPDNKKITGIVISDVSNKNIDSKTVVLQEAAGQNGIIITFDAAQTFALGDQVEVVISNQTLAQVNGEIELTNIPAANAKKTGTGTITAKASTASDIATNKAAWDGTLVSITSTDLTLTGGNGKYAGALTLTDASGIVSSNVLAGAAFENTAYPVSVSSVTGIVRVSGNNIRLDIRKTADISSGAITHLVTEDFTNVMPVDGFDPGLPSFIGQSSGFTTAAGAWQNIYASPIGFLPGAEYDGSFTTTGRSYVYIGASPSNPNRNSLSSAFTNLTGLKQVSITFAGSKISGDLVFPYNGDLRGPIAPFNAATDYFQVAISPSFSGGNSLVDPQDPTASSIVKTSTKYTQNGQFFTITWAVPTKEQLVAAGVDELSATLWLQDLNIKITNLSTRADGGVYAPILIDKIVFGF